MMAEWTREPFGVTVRGERVDQWIAVAGSYTAKILTYGGILRSFQVEDRDVVLGCDTLADYEKQDKYFGALVGRVANRIRGAAFDLNGEHYTMAANNGPTASTRRYGRPASMRESWSSLTLVPTGRRTSPVPWRCGSAMI